MEPGTYFQHFPDPGWTRGSLMPCEKTEYGCIVWENKLYFVPKVDELEHETHLYISNADIFEVLDDPPSYTFDCDKTKTDLCLPKNTMVSFATIESQYVKVLDIKEDGTLIFENSKFPGDDSIIPNVIMSGDEGKLTEMYVRLDEATISANVWRVRWKTNDGKDHVLYGVRNVTKATYIKEKKQNRQKKNGKKTLSFI